MPSRVCERAGKRVEEAIFHIAVTSERRRRRNDNEIILLFHDTPSRRMPGGRIRDYRRKGITARREYRFRVQLGPKASTTSAAWPGRPVLVAQWPLPPAFARTACCYWLLPTCRPRRQYRQRR